MTAGGSAFNVAGCIVAVTGDSSITSCAQKYDDVNQCVAAACTAQCPVMTPQDIPAFEQCTNDAMSTVCSSWVAAECSTDAGFYTQCIASGSNDPETSFDAIAGAMCGP
jgi:hypothetical protein